MSITEPDTGAVPTLAKQRERRLQELLARRERLARLTIERQSHDCDDAVDLLYDVLIVEEAIRTRYPAAYRELYNDWIDSDVKRMHTPRTRHPECSLCEALETTVGTLSPGAA